MPTFLSDVNLPRDPTAALHTATKQYVDQRVLKAGDTMTGNLIVDVASAGATIGLDVDATYLAQIQYTKAGSARWLLRMDGSAETGGDAGNNLLLISRHDDGTQNNYALSVNRATGRVSLASDPVSALDAATKQYVDLRALIASPTFTGVPAAPTAAVDTNTTQIATTAYVVGQGYLKTATASGAYQPLDADLTTIAGLIATTGNMILSVGSAWASQTPTQVKTALALNNVDNTSDANKPVSTAQAAADALKANLASPTFTGTPAAPTATAGTNTTQLATTAFVTTADNLKANLASPTFTGVPAAPTATVGTNTTQIATTAFVLANSGGISQAQGDARYLQLTGGTLTGALNGTDFSAVSDTASVRMRPAGYGFGAYVDINGTINEAAQVEFQTDGSPKWRIGRDDDGLNTFELAIQNGSRAFSADYTTRLMTVAADPTAALGIATKQYVDTRALKAGDTMTGLLVTAVPTTATAMLRLPHGTAPTSPVNGDIWSTTAGMYHRINGVTVGPLGLSDASFNTEYGSETQTTATGGNNTAFGYRAQRYLTTGTDNVAVGNNAMGSTSVTGTGNVAIGVQALYGVTSAISNTAVGMDALKLLTNGQDNVAVGRGALATAGGTYWNVAVGRDALGATTGGYSVAIGYKALASQSTGDQNVAIGSQAGFAPGGGFNVTSTGKYQTTVGRNSGQYVSGTVDSGTALGDSAQYNAKGTALGANAQARGVQSTAIGYGATATADNTIMLGTATERVYTNNDPINPTEVATKQYVDARTPKVTVGNVAPSSPAVGDVWMDTT